MRGTSVAQALKCALKVKAGKTCTVAELAGALDTLAWAYSKGKKPIKRVARKTKRTVKNTYRKIR